MAFELTLTVLSLLQMGAPATVWLPVSPAEEQACAEAFKRDNPGVWTEVACDRYGFAWTLRTSDPALIQQPPVNPGIFDEAEQKSLRDLLVRNAARLGIEHPQELAFTCSPGAARCEVDQRLEDTTVGQIVIRKIVQGPTASKVELDLEGHLWPKLGLAASTTDEEAVITRYVGAHYDAVTPKPGLPCDPLPGQTCTRTPPSMSHAEIAISDPSALALGRGVGFLRVAGDALEAHRILQIQLASHDLGGSGPATFQPLDGAPPLPQIVDLATGATLVAGGPSVEHLLLP